MPVTPGQVADSFASLLNAMANRTTLLELRVTNLENELDITPPPGTGDGDDNPPPNEGTASYTRRTNVGGSAYTDDGGNVWAADTGFVGGATSTQGVGHTFGTTADTVYEDERFGNFTYTFTGATPGNGRVVLHFSENQPATNAAGERLFNVVVNGVTVLTNWDTYVQAGNSQYKGVQKVIDMVVPANGVVTVQFVTVVNAAAVMAIEVFGYGTASNPTDPPPDTDPPPPPPVGGFWYSGGSNNINSMAAVTAWATMRGRANTLNTCYTSRDGSWDAFVSSHALSGQPALFNDPNMILLVQTPPFPRNTGSTYAAAAAGAYDNYYRQIGTILKNRAAAGIRSILSPGWEMNGTYMYWGGGSGATHHGGPASFKAAIQRMITQVRSTYPGCPTAFIINAHATPSSVGTTNAWDFFPGSQYITYAGTDDYDHYPPSGNTVPNTAFTNRANAVDGMEYIANKIRAERAAGGAGANLQMIIGEWGVVSGQGPNGGGDNPGYIENMYNKFVTYHNEGIFFGEYYFGDLPGIGSDLITMNGNSKTRYISKWHV